MKLHYYSCTFQKNALYMWDIGSSTPSFVNKREIQGLELPKGTVLEIEILPELHGEVSVCLGL